MYKGEANCRDWLRRLILLRVLFRIEGTNGMTRGRLGIR